MERAKLFSQAALATILCVCLPNNATAAYTFTNFDFPGAVQTIPLGINDPGQIVGGYYNPSSGTAHGFLLSGGTFTTIDYPGASGTQPNGINNAGQVVGFYCAGSCHYGFTFPFLLSGGVFYALPEAPGSMPGTTKPWAINTSGQIVGLYTDPCFCKQHGFLLSGGVFTTIDDPGYFGSSAYGINDAGQIVGYGQNGFGSGPAHGFLLSGGVFTAIDFPGVFSTIPTGINISGQVVGYTESPGVPNQGFLLSGGTYTAIVDPNAGSSDDTSIQGPGINAAGQIVGAFGNPNHGFFASPPSTYSICLLYDSTKVSKAGSTVPIKLQLCNSTGTNLSSSSVIPHAISVSQSSSNTTGVVADSGSANPDNDFRYDPTIGSSGGYIFNLNTKGLAPGTYTLNFRVGSDATTYAAPFQLK
ncbi:MAG: PxKF domain-containing protein [Acidobacteriota bacterium]